MYKIHFTITSFYPPTHTHKKKHIPYVCEESKTKNNCHQCHWFLGTYMYTSATNAATELFILKNKQHVIPILDYTSEECSTLLTLYKQKNYIACLILYLKLQTFPFTLRCTVYREVYNLHVCPMKNTAYLFFQK